MCNRIKVPKLASSAFKVLRRLQTSEHPCCLSLPKATCFLWLISQGSFKYVNHYPLAGFCFLHNRYTLSRKSSVNWLSLVTQFVEFFGIYYNYLLLKNYLLRCCHNNLFLQFTTLDCLNYQVIWHTNIKKKKHIGKQNSKFYFLL